MNTKGHQRNSPNNLHPMQYRGHHLDRVIRHPRNDFNVSSFRCILCKMVYRISVDKLIGLLHRSEDNCIRFLTGREVDLNIPLWFHSIRFYEYP